MRRVRYSVAASLDGFIAGPKGEADWIVMDPEIDFGELFRQFDAVLMGRKTFDFARARGGGGSMPGMEAFVFSRTLRAKDHPGVTIVADRAKEIVTALRKRPGKDVWLMGGGELFRCLNALGLVDTVEVAIIPVLLGGGIPLLPGPAERTRLELKSQRVLKKTGIVMMEYSIR